jgi:hypothetical protein
MTALERFWFRWYRKHLGLPAIRAKLCSHIMKQELETRSWRPSQAFSMARWYGHTWKKVPERIVASTLQQYL